MRPIDYDELRVHADALIEAGDPRGELIALALEVRRAPNVQAWKRHQRLMAREIERLRQLGFREPAVHLGWECGFVDALDVTMHRGSPWFVMPVVRDPAFARLRALKVIATDAIGGLAPIIEALPRLESLDVLGPGVDVAGLAHAALRWLILPALAADAQPALATLDLPVLDRLSIQPLVSVAPLLAARLPALTALTLRQTSVLPLAVLDQLLPRAPQLTSLSLGLVDEAWLPALAAHAAALAHISLTLETRNVDRARASGLARVIPKVHIV